MIASAYSYMSSVLYIHVHVAEHPSGMRDVAGSNLAQGSSIFSVKVTDCFGCMHFIFLALSCMTFELFTLIVIVLEQHLQTCHVTVSLTSVQRHLCSV